MLILSIASDIKFGVLDILRSIGIGIINMIYSTIDVLYNVAHKINSLDFIEILKNIDNSPFTKIFNSFIIVAFALLFLFSIWKITFRIFDADEQEQPLSFLIKEICKCGVLIFLVSLIFTESIDIGTNLSTAIYNTFTNANSTIGDTMKTAYLTVNDNCYYNSGGYKYHKDSAKVDKENVSDLKEQLDGYVEIPDTVKTVEDFSTLIRNGSLTATKITDSGAFPLTCQIYKPGIWNDGEDYFFNYNWVFGIVVGVIFLFSIGFSVVMLGRRQLELAFLMLIAPFVFATSICRKEQRSALYQQLVSLVLQAGALLLLIGLSAIMFNAIQNSSDINALPYFTRIVAQSILYVGCAMMLLTGSNVLNRFIGENVSANSGRDTMMAMRGLMGGMLGGSLATIGVAKGAEQAGKGIVQMGNAGRLGLAGITDGNMHNRTVKSMANKMNKAQEKIRKGQEKQKSGTGLASKLSGMYQEYSGNKKMDALKNKWDFDNNKVRSGYFKDGKNLAKSGLSNIAHSFMGYRGYNSSLGNLKNTRRIPIQSFKNDDDKL